MFHKLITLTGFILKLSVISIMDNITWINRDTQTHMDSKWINIDQKTNGFNTCNIDGLMQYNRHPSILRYIISKL